MYDPASFLSDLAGGTSFDTFSGATGYGEVAQLLKSLSAGNDTSIAEANASDNSTGFALRPQSLEKTLTLLTFSDKHIVFWKDIPKEGAKSTVEEFNTLESYGSESISAFMAEGELPSEDDSVYARNLMKVKFMGTLRSVTDPFGLVANANGDPIANETVNGVRWLTRQVERSLFHADSDIIPTEFDGFRKMMGMGGSIVLDARDYVGGMSPDAAVGGTITKDLLDEVTERVFTDYFGAVDRLYYSTVAHRKFGRSIGYDPNSGDSISRLDIKNVNGGDIVPGFRMGRIATLNGDVALKPDIFLNTPGYTENDLTGSKFAKGAKQPAAPTYDSQPTLGAVDGAKWGTIASIQYKYAIVALSPSGNSIGVVSNAVTIDNAAKKITTGPKPGVGGAVAPSGFLILRTQPHAAAAYDAATTKFYEVGRVKADGSNAVSFIDRNAIVAGTSFGFAMTSEENTFAWKQLAPPMKIPLAKIDLRSRWAQVLYGAPILRAPKKCVLITNLA